MANLEVTCARCGKPDEIGVADDAKGHVLWECSPCGMRNLHDTGQLDDSQVVPPVDNEVDNHVVQADGGTGVAALAPGEAAEAEVPVHAPDAAEQPPVP